jgi:hypothetical protein
MDGKLPEIYWYVFWIGFVLLGVAGMLLGAMLDHRRRLQALDILKTYAEKGAEPPPAMMEQLAQQALEPQQGATPKRDSRAALVQGFIGFLFMACVAWGVSEWLLASDGPPWAQIAATATEAFFGFGAFGFIVAALLTRTK